MSVKVEIFLIIMRSDFFSYLKNQNLSHFKISKFKKLQRKEIFEILESTHAEDTFSISEKACSLDSGYIVDLRLILIVFTFVDKKDSSYFLFFWLCSFLNLFYCTAKSFNYRNFS